MPIIPAHGRLRQEDCKLKASVGYTARAYLKTKQKKSLKGLI
jgi:hypothetical protein